MTENDVLRLERQLDRLQTFYPRIDAKVSALFAISSAQIAVAALNLSVDDLTRWWIAVPLAVFLIVISWAFFQLYRCAYPHLKGGASSLVYFNEIAKLRESDYVAKLSAVSNDEWGNDVGGQIWRNAEIIACKYGYLKEATLACSISLVPWTVLLVSTSLTNWRTPIVGS